MKEQLNITVTGKDGSEKTMMVGLLTKLLQYNRFNVRADDGEDVGREREPNAAARLRQLSDMRRNTEICISSAQTYSSGTSRPARSPAVADSEVHVVLDLETLGTTPGSVILSIGAAFLTKADGIFASAELGINVSNSISNGFTTDADTFAWWGKQSAFAQSTAFGGGLTVTDALKSFADVMERHSPAHVWGNGVIFDNAILKAAYDKMNLPVPWSYQQDRCFRTIRAMYPEIADDVAFAGTPHVASHDAVHEAEILWKYLQR